MGLEYELCGSAYSMDDRNVKIFVDERAAMNALKKMAWWAEYDKLLAKDGIGSGWVRGEGKYADA